jgi:hypothetical protein
MDVVILSVRPAGLEPATSEVQIACSIQLSYGRYASVQAATPMAA